MYVLICQASVENGESRSQEECKHQIKEIVEIDEHHVLEIDGLLKEEDWISVDSYISSVLEHNEYEVSIKVKNFNGYKFIYYKNLILYYIKILF